MPKLAVTVALFSIGFVIAILVFLFDNYAAVSNLSLEASRSRALEELDQDRFEQNSAKIPAPIVAQLLSPERLVEVLSFAVDEGTINSLQMIRTEYLRSLPSYRSVVLPELKRQTLEGLLDRFNEFDWKQWPRASFASKKGPSSARRFVNDVGTVNPELGRFLETSAQLMHGLYSSVYEGYDYDVSSDLQNMIDQAEYLRSVSNKVGAPALEAYDLSVADDPSFRVVMEKHRCDLTMNYMINHSDNVVAHLALLRGLAPRYCNASIGVHVRNTLHKLIVDASAEFRRKVYYDDKLMRVFVEFAEQHHALKSIVAVFYLIGAMDALQSDDPHRAQNYVENAGVLSPNLALYKKVHRAVADELRRSSPEGAGYVRAQMGDANWSPGASELEALSEPKKSPVKIFVFLFVGLLASGLIVILLIGLTRYLAYWRSIDALPQAIGYEERHLVL